jgi:hypothetical protein
MSSVDDLIAKRMTQLGQSFSSNSPKTPLTEGMITPQEKVILQQALRLDMTDLGRRILHSDNGSEIKLLKLASDRTEKLFNKVSGW